MGSQLLNIHALKTNNYEAWAIRSRATLRAGGLWGIVDGTCTRPVSDSEDIAKWIHHNGLALAQIMSWVDDVQLNYIRDCATAYEAWTKLRAVHESRGRQRVVSSLELLDFQLEESEPVDEATSRLNKMIQSLGSLEVLIPEPMRIAIFLRGLPKTWAVEPTISFAWEEMIDKVKLEDKARRDQEKTTAATPRETAQAVYEIATGVKQRRKSPSTRRKGGTAAGNEVPKNETLRGVEKHIGSRIDVLAKEQIPAESAKKWWLQIEAYNMAAYKESFVDLTECHAREIQISAGFTVVVRGFGAVTVPIGGHFGVLNILDVLWVPELGINILSLSALWENGIRFESSMGPEEISLNGGTKERPSDISLLYQGHILATATAHEHKFLLDIQEEIEDD